MSFLEFLGIAFIGFLTNEYVRYSMDETSIFSHKKQKWGFNNGYKITNSNYGQ